MAVVHAPAVSGHLAVVTDDGEAMDVGAGSVYEIPPRHDGWVVGDEPFETVEWSIAVAVEGAGRHALKGLSREREVHRATG